MKEITAYTIIETMEKWVKERHPISAGQWLDASAKLNVLRGELDDRYFEIESEIAVMKKDLLSKDDMSVAKADSIIKAEPLYLKMRKLGGDIKRIEEFIKIAKKQSTLKDIEYSQVR